MDVGPDYLATLGLTDSVTIGVNEGEMHEMLGDIADVHVGPDGHVYIPDSGLSAVLIYEPDGTFVGSFGRAGNGPGEFTSAQSFWFSDAGRYAVIFALQIHVFERQQEGQYTDLFRILGGW